MYVDEWIADDTITEPGNITAVVKAKFSGTALPVDDPELYDEFISIAAKNYTEAGITMQDVQPLTAEELLNDLAGLTNNLSETAIIGRVKDILSDEELNSTLSFPPGAQEAINQTDKVLLKEDLLFENLIKRSNNSIVHKYIEAILEPNDKLLQEYQNKYVVIGNAGRGRQFTWPNSDEPGLYSKEAADKIVDELMAKRGNSMTRYHAQPLSTALDYIGPANKAYDSVLDLLKETVEGNVDTVDYKGYTITVHRNRGGMYTAKNDSGEPYMNVPQFKTALEAIAWDKKNIDQMEESAPIERRRKKESFQRSFIKKKISKLEAELKAFQAVAPRNDKIAKKYMEDIKTEIVYFKRKLKSKKEGTVSPHELVDPESEYYLGDEADAVKPELDSIGHLRNIDNTYASMERDLGKPAADFMRKYYNSLKQRMISYLHDSYPWSKEYDQDADDWAEQVEVFYNDLKSTFGDEDDWDEATARAVAENYMYAHPRWDE